MRCFRAALPSLLALAGLAACGDVHRPFQPDDKPLSHALLRRTDHAGVIVMPLSGAADDVQSLDFGAALAAALRAADVLAHNGAGNRDSPVLSSYLERGAADDGNLVLWLSNGAGTDIGTYEFRVRLRDLLSDTAGRRTLLRNLAQRIAAELDPERARARATPPVFIARMEVCRPPKARRSNARSRSGCSAPRSRSRNVPARTRWSWPAASVSRTGLAGR